MTPKKRPNQPTSLTVSCLDVIPGCRDPVNATVGFRYWGQWAIKLAPKDGLDSQRAKSVGAERKQSSRFGAVKQAFRPSAAKRKTPKRSGESNHSSDNAGCESVGVAWLSKHFRVPEDSDNQATTRNASPPRWHRSRRKFQEESFDSKNSDHLRVQASE